MHLLYLFSSVPNAPSLDNGDIITNPYDSANIFNTS